MAGFLPSVEARDSQRRQRRISVVPATGKVVGNSRRRHAVIANRPQPKFAESGVNLHHLASPTREGASIYADRIDGTAVRHKARERAG